VDLPSYFAYIAGYDTSVHIDNSTYLTLMPTLVVLSCYSANVVMYAQLMIVFVCIDVDKFPSCLSADKTVFRTVYGNNKYFFSAESIVICDCHGREFRVALPWDLLYYDN